MFRKLMVVMLAISLLLTSIGSVSLALGDADFVVNSGVLTSYTGTDTMVVIPGNLGITRIAGYAFPPNSSRITSLTIPAGVSIIDTEAFSYCSGLTEFIVDAGNLNFSSENGVLFNKSKTVLVEYPSKNAATAYTIPDGVETVGAGAFSYSKNLTSINFPNSVASIGKNAFSYCSNIASVAIPNAVAVISEGAFNNCINLSSVEIPGSVTTIGNKAFFGCDRLVSVTIPDSVLSVGNSAFMADINLYSITVPESVTVIGQDAFGLCENATIYGTAGSFASQYAAANNIPFSVQTAASDALGCDIESLSINGNSGVIVGQNILVKLPAGTDVTALAPQIEISENATVSPGGAQDFSSPVVYRVTAADGVSYKDYTVTVKVLAEGTLMIKPVISNTDLVPGETLTIAFDMTGVTGSNGVGSVNLNFSFDPLKFKYVSETHLAGYNETPMTDWVVGYNNITKRSFITFSDQSGGSNPILADCTLAAISLEVLENAPLGPSSIVIGKGSVVDGEVNDIPSSVITSIIDFDIENENSITEFSIGGFKGKISGQNITVALPTGTNVKSLMPQVKCSAGSSILTIGAKDFTNSVTYSVKSANGAIKNYTVKVEPGTVSDKLIFLSTTMDIATFKTSLNLSSNLKVKIIDPNGLDITAIGYSGLYNYMATGMTVEIYAGEILTDSYKVVLKGDCSPSGSIDGTDLLKMKKYISGYETLKNEQLIAANYNSDASLYVNGSDLLAMQRYILGIS